MKPFSDLKVPMLKKQAIKYKKQIKTLNTVLKMIEKIVDHPPQWGIKQEREELGKLYCRTKQKIYDLTKVEPMSKTKCKYRSPDIVGRMVRITNIDENSLDSWGIPVGAIGFVVDSSKGNSERFIVEFPEYAGLLHNAWGESSINESNVLFVDSSCLEFVEE